MSQKLPVGGFYWVEQTSHFNEDFIKRHNEDRDIRYFLLKLMFSIWRNCMIFIMIYRFYLKECKLKKLKNLRQICMIKKYAIHMKKIEQILNHGLKLKKMH